MSNLINKKDRIKDFFAGLKGEKVAVCGVAVNNLPVALQFAAHGASVTACDRRSYEELGENAETLSAAGVSLSLGEDYLADICNKGADLILRTPGMKPHLKEFNQARAKGITVTSEMELFLSLCPANVTAVTGSDGKSTTTSIIAGLYEAGGFKVHLGGNIGRPLLPIIETVEEDDQVVVELSSFQLMMMTQSPPVSVITNLAPNHLDWHKDMTEYVDAKKNIFLWQQDGGKVILNRDNETCFGLAGEVKNTSHLMLFSRCENIENGSFCDSNGDIYLSTEGEKRFVMNSKDIWLEGVHNVENFLAAFCAVSDRLHPEVMKEFAENFKGIKHRCEFLREHKGVKWYNDSIASSPSRTIAGLKTFGRKVILLAGGYDKQIPYEPLGIAAADYVKTAVLFGATADKIEKEIRLYSPDTQILRASDLTEAFKTARGIAVDGDIVFMSPASASFDMFKNFEERGDLFRKLVNEIDSKE